MNPFKKLLLTLILSLLAAACFGGCSEDEEEDDPDFFDDAEVVDLSLEDSTIEIEDATILAVEFSFDASRVFDDEENVVVVVRLPEGLEFRDGTSEIDGVAGDEEIGAQIVRCSGSDETFLIFDMDEFDLADASNPPGDADAVLTLTVEGTEALDLETIDAVASADRPAFSCGENFVSDEQVAITVEG